MVTEFKEVENQLKSTEVLHDFIEEIYTINKILIENEFYNFSPFNTIDTGQRMLYALTGHGCQFDPHNIPCDYDAKSTCNIDISMTARDLLRLVGTSRKYRHLHID